MKLTNLISFILFLPFLFSCEKIIPLENESSSNKIVVNSLFSTDSLWKIHLSYSKSVIGSTDYKYVENALIKIIDSNGKQITNFQYLNDGFYESNSFPKTNEKYFLKINNNNDSVSSFDKVPQHVSATNIDTSSFVKNGQNRIKISLKFTDPKNENNYYKVAVKTKKTKIDLLGQDNIIDTSIIENWIKLFQESEVLERTSENSELIFNDLTFNGENFNVEFSIKNLIKKFDQDESVFLNLIDVYFYTISESVYNYHKSIKIYNDIEGIPLIQPVQVFSNIDNGYGIFAGASSDIINVYK